MSTGYSVLNNIEPKKNQNESVTELKVPRYFSQEDPRWRNFMFSSHGDSKQTIGSSGCGPTAFAIAVTNITGKTILPPVICDFVIKNGYRTYNNGVEHRFIKSASKEYGLNYEQTQSLDRVVEFLEYNQGMVLCALGVGHFTGAGHFIVLYDVEVNNETFIHVMDPNMDNKRYWKYNDGGVIEVYEKDDGFVKAKAKLIHNENRIKSYYLLSE